MNTTQDNVTGIGKDLIFMSLYVCACTNYNVNDIPWCHGTVVTIFRGTLVRKFQAGFPEISGPISCSTRFRSLSFDHKSFSAFQNKDNVVDYFEQKGCQLSTSENFITCMHIKQRFRFSITQKNKQINRV